MTIWAYFAGKAKADKATTLNLVCESFFLCRPARNASGQAIANVRSVRVGDRILLCYDHDPVAWLEVVAPEVPLDDPTFPAVTRMADPEIESVLDDWDYQKDPLLGEFTGFQVEPRLVGAAQLELQSGTAPVQKGRNALQRLEDTLGGADAVVRHLEARSAWRSTEDENVEFVSVGEADLAGSSRSRRGTQSIRRGETRGGIAPLEARAPAPPPTLRVTEHFLGVDVGFSTKRESLGYCIVALEPAGEGLVLRIPQGGQDTVRHGAQGNRYLEQFLASTLPDILACVPLSGAALDGPMTPHLGPIEGATASYRPCEQLLLQGGIPRAIRGQGFLLPVGKVLYASTMEIRDDLVSAGLRYLAFPEAAPAQNDAPFVLESFPKLFLGLLRPPEEGTPEHFATRGIERTLRDRHMARECFARGRDGALPGPRARLLKAGLAIDDGLLEAALADRDIAAAFVSAVGAVLFRLGWAAVLGSPQWGALLAPAAHFWHPEWRPLVARALDSALDLGLGRAAIRDLV